MLCVNKNVRDLEKLVTCIVVPFVDCKVVVTGDCCHGWGRYRRVCIGRDMAHGRVR